MRTKRILAIGLMLITLFTAMAVTAQADGTETRTITFVSEGGSYIAPLTESYGTLRCIKDYVPVKDGYMFQGWYVNLADKSQRVTEYTFNDDITLYAGWMSNATYITQPATVGVDLIYLTDGELAEHQKELEARQEPQVSAPLVKQEATPPVFTEADWNRFFVMLQYFMQSYTK